MSVSLNGGTPKTPKKRQFLVGNPWLLGTTILGNPHIHRKNDGKGKECVQPNSTNRDCINPQAHQTRRNMSIMSILKAEKVFQVRLTPTPPPKKKKLTYIYIYTAPILPTSNSSILSNSQSSSATDLDLVKLDSQVDLRETQKTCQQISWCPFWQYSSYLIPWLFTGMGEIYAPKYLSK